MSRFEEPCEARVVADKLLGHTLARRLRQLRQV